MKPSNSNETKSPHPVRLRRLAMNPKMDPNRRDYALALADVIEGFDKKGIKSHPNRIRPSRN